MRRSTIVHNVDVGVDVMVYTLPDGNWFVLKWLCFICIWFSTNNVWKCVFYFHFLLIKWTFFNFSIIIIKQIKYILRQAEKLHHQHQSKYASILTIFVYQSIQNKQHCCTTLFISICVIFPVLLNCAMSPRAKLRRRKRRKNRHCRKINEQCWAWWVW